MEAADVIDYLPFAEGLSFQWNPSHRLPRSPCFRGVLGVDLLSINDANAAYLVVVRGTFG